LWYIIVQLVEWWWLSGNGIVHMTSSLHQARLVIRWG